MHRVLALLILSIMLSGCYTLKATIAMTKSTDHFITSKESTYVKYEKGSEKYASEIVRHIDESIDTVESIQYGKFPEEVIVYVPDSVKSFASYCASEIPRACVIGGRVFISPRMLKQPELIKEILIHELSHLHLSQNLGRWNYQSKIPSWFSEGLAVFISNGGGAEKVTKIAAENEIRKGNSFEPNESGSFLFPKTAADFGLEHQMYYRQTSLFVEWLYGVNSEGFNKLISLLRKDYSLNEAMLNSYGFSVKDGWFKYLNEIRT